MCDGMTVKSKGAGYNEQTYIFNVTNERQYIAIKNILRELLTAAGMIAYELTIKCIDVIDHFQKRAISEISN